MPREPEREDDEREMLDNAPANELPMTLLIVGAMAWLVLLIAIIPIADRHPPAGL